MSSIRIAAALALSAAVTAQSTWVVDPTGAGNFTSLAQAHAAAAPGDTLVLVGTLTGASLTTPLRLVAHGAYVSTTLLLGGPGSMSVAGGTFAYVEVAGTTASFDGVAATLGLTNGARVAARGCTFVPGTTGLNGVFVSLASWALLDGCSLQGRNAAGGFGSLFGAPGLRVDGRAELRACTIAGGLAFVQPSWTVPGAPAIQVNGSVELRDCVLTSGAGQPLLAGAGTVRAQNTVTQNAVPSTPTVTTTPLPWTTGTGAPPGGVLQARVDGPALTLTGVAACLGMHPPAASPFGAVWLDLQAAVPIAAGFTDASGAMNATVPLPLAVPRGLQVTFQSILWPTGGELAVTPPAILQVL